MSLLIKFLTVSLAVFVSGAFFGTDESHAEAVSVNPSNQPLRFTVLYDNYLHRPGTKSDWGFSCFIEGMEKIILFDTGSRPEILMSNADFLKVDMKKVDIIVISHNHGDHTGGLSAILERNPDVMVYFPISFPSEFGRRIESLKAKIQTVDRPVEICRNVYLTGEMGDVIFNHRHSQRTHHCHRLLPPGYRQHPQAG
jgi:7,8-dihydropterin-6-yl-methyl-4-(beta-D-ribofuranosyl)aminobenzene 5'-phosphate synthase